MPSVAARLRAPRVLRVDRAPSVTTSATRVLLIASLGYLLASWAMNPVSAILPTISSELAIDPARTGWVMNAYFLLLVGWVLVAGRLGDAFGHGAVFRLGCLVFAAGSVLGALPGGFVGLLVGRAVQGTGSAMLFGTTLAIVAAAFQGRRLAWAIGILTMSSGVSAIVGVWVSTALAQRVGWQWAFAVPAVVGLLVAASSHGLPSVRRTRARDLDWLGAGLLFGALTLLLLGLNHLHAGAQTFEAGVGYHLSTQGASLVFLAGFFWRELRTSTPLIPLRVFGDLRLTTGVLANGIAHSSMLATGLLLPFLLERGRGYTPNETAGLLVIMQASLMAGSYGGGWLFSRRGTPAIGVVSISALAGGLLLLGKVGADLPLEALLGVVAVLGAGLGSFTAVNNTAVMRSVAADQRGFASGLVETTRQLGHSVGVSLSSGLLAASIAAAAVPAAGYRTGFSDAALLMGLVSASGVLAVLYPTLRARLQPGRAVG